VTGNTAVILDLYLSAQTWNSFIDEMLILLKLCARLFGIKPLSGQTAEALNASGPVVCVIGTHGFVGVTLRVTKGQPDVDISRGKFVKTVSGKLAIGLAGASAARIVSETFLTF
jgi:hypothetical protein